MAVVEMIIPKMGESIIEATIISWMKQEGDRVEEEEILLEIATDKVDSEVPAPASGTITKILAQPDQVVAVGGVVALIETDASAETSNPAASEPKQVAPAVKEKKEEIPQTSTSTSAPIPAPQVATSVEKSVAHTPIQLTRKSRSQQIPSNVDGRFFSPLVRNIARAEGISLDELLMLNGSGAEGRVTKYDLLNYIDLRKTEKTSTIKRAEVVRDTTTLAPQITPSATPSAPQTSQAHIPQSTSASTGDVIQLSRMRKMIAKHMRHSLETAAHVTSFVEADATRLVNWRKRIKADFQRVNGEKISLSPLFAEAVIKAIKEFPI